MDCFHLLQLERVKWIMLLDKENIIDGVKNYELYRDIILKSGAAEDVIKKELEYSSKLFQEKIVALGNKFFENKDYIQAIDAFSEGFKNDNKDVDCIKKYANCLNELKQYDLEMLLLKHLEETGGIENYKYVAIKYEARGLYSEAFELIQKYVAQIGEDNLTAEEYNIYGFLCGQYYINVSRKREDINRAIKYFSKAADLVPESKMYISNAAVAASRGNDFAAGRKYWEKLLTFDNLTNNDKYYYSSFCLKNGDFEGWRKFFDVRFDKETDAATMPKIEKPKWDGNADLSNSTLLVHCEQGFGDTFLEWGYMPRLLKLAKHIIFVVQKGIYTLLKDNDWGIEIYSNLDVNLNELNFDYYIPAMSIPVVLKLDASNISVGQGYIKPKKELIDLYKQKYFDNDKFKIGISFSGNKDGDKTRDIPIKEFLPLDKLDNVAIYNFTKDAEESNFDIFKNHKVINVVKYAGDFADTAAMLKNCDLLLTSDSGILNLAGALGIKTFGLFNFDYNSRWYDLSGEDTGYYTSVKPYVCKDLDDWKSAIRPAIEDIKKLIYFN